MGTEFGVAGHRAKLQVTPPAAPRDLGEASRNHGHDHNGTRIVGGGAGFS
jgi:hypothetical protein